MIDWFKHNILNKKEKKFRVCFIYKDKQKMFLDINAVTPSRAVKSAKIYISKFSSNKSDYKFQSVKEL